MTLGRELFNEKKRMSLEHREGQVRRHGCFESTLLFESSLTIIDTKVVYTVFAGQDCL